MRAPGMTFNRLPLCLLLHCITLELGDFYRLAQQVIEFSMVYELWDHSCPAQKRHDNAIRRLHLDILHIIPKQLL